MNRKSNKGRYWVVGILYGIGLAMAILGVPWWAWVSVCNLGGLILLELD